MSKLVEYGRDLSAGVWVSGAIAFMVLAVVIGIVQEFRLRRGKVKDEWDLPVFVLAPIAGLWLIFSIAGVATATFFMVAPVIRWLAKLI